MESRSDEARRYRILDVIGEGGFGKVYRARLEGAEGFAKDVAIKLLTDAQAPDEVLKRFRDESRILGLIRDRAIVTVDPPTRLDGRWAVVMEFVDGANCHRLLRKAPVPPRVALEVIGEVARALHNVYHQQGPDGEPLRLIHRDIKPSNIQVTPTGSVKILDFGIARASFGARESRTTTHIGGTFGYIAPERLEGIEGPEGDIYSLGVTLAAMVAGRRPKADNREQIVAWVAEDPDTQAAWDLSLRMRAQAPDERPSARDVEDLCLELAQGMKGRPLRRWAEHEVKEAALAVDDDLVGSVLTETMAYVPRVSTAEIAKIETSSGTSRVPLFLAAALVAVVLLVSVAFGAAGLGALFVGRGPAQVHTVTIPVAEPPRHLERPVEAHAEDTDAAGVAAGEEAEEVEEDGSDGGGGADGAAEDAAEGVEAEVPETEVPEPVVAAAPVVRARPAPAPRPAPKPVATFPVTFGSVPFGATVFIDGKKRGDAPLQLDLTEGRHQVRMEHGDAFLERRIEVGRREPVKHIWKGGNDWYTYY